MPVRHPRTPNEQSIKHIASGKFTLGGDAAAVAGPMGKRGTAAVTGKAEVYIYTRSRGGLYAGAAFEGARLDIDEEGGAAFYGGDDRAALAAPGPATPAAATRFLDTRRGVTSSAGLVSSTGPSSAPPAGSNAAPSGPAEEAVIYPIEEAPR